MSLHAIEMRMKRAGCLAAFLLSAALTRAQSQGDSVVQNPIVTVRDTPLFETPSYSSQVGLSGEGVAPDASAWDELGAATANFHAFEGGAGGYGSLLSMRGLSNTPYFSEPALTAYFGDIPMPGGFAYPQDLFGFASANVTPGPAGTLFGRATDGGVVVFALPGEAATAGGLLSSSFASEDSRHEEIEAHGSSAGAFDFEAMGAYGARDGYIENETLGMRVDSQENESAFARLRYGPASGTQVSLELLDTRSRDGAQPLVPLGGALYTVERSHEGVTDLDSVGAALKVSLPLQGGGSFSSDSSFTNWRMDPYVDYLTTPVALLSAVSQEQKSWNEEARLALRPAAGLRVDSGLWLSRASTENEVSRELFAVIPVDQSGFAQTSESAAIFSEASLEVNPSLILTAGLRAEDDTKSFSRTEEVPASLFYQGEGRYRALLPKAQARWRLADQSLLVATLALGLRPGGFASFTDNPALIPFASERSTAYMLGWEKFVPALSLHLAARAFYDAIANYQIERSFTPVDYLVATAPEAHSEGVELDAHWALGSAFEAGFDAGLDQARLDRFTAPLTGQVENGASAPAVPALTAGLEATVRPAKGWHATGRLTLVGRTHFDELGSALFTQDAYAVANLETGYATARWALTFYCENAGKAGYYSLIIPGVTSGVPGAPRTVGSRMQLRF